MKRRPRAQRNTVTRDLTRFAAAILILAGRGRPAFVHIVSYTKTTYPNGDVVAALELA